MSMLAYTKKRAKNYPFSREAGSLDERLTAEALIARQKREAHEMAVREAPSDTVTALLVDFGDVPLSELVNTAPVEAEPKPCLVGKCACGCPVRTSFDAHGYPIWEHTMPEVALSHPHVPGVIYDVHLSTGS